MRLQCAIMKAAVNYFVTCILFALFLWQAWSTISKFQESKTYLQVVWILPLCQQYFPITQVTYHDDGHILFPSVTFCKNYMYTHNDGFLHKLKEEKLSSSEYKKIFREQTWSRGQLLKTVHHNHNTLDGSFKFPCTTIDGPNSGFPCSFPFVYPDCSESFRPKNQCEWN